MTEEILHAEHELARALVSADKAEVLKLVRRYLRLMDTCTNTINLTSDVRFSQETENETKHTA